VLCVHGKSNINNRANEVRIREGMDGLLPEGVTTVSKTDLEPFANGKRVGSYLFGRTIGEGSFAKVKEGIHVSTGGKVAIKIINKKKASADRYVSRNLKREAEIMQKVRHQNVVRLLEVMETDSFYYLVTELCCGGELLDLICERKYLDEDTARRYIAQLVSAVYSMHLRGVLHRDLKIENFLLDQQGDLKIVDFGLSNCLSDDGLEAWNRAGICPLMLTTYCGSPAYAAPELLAQKPYGAQIDVWSIGVNMFAMLTGNLPYNMERLNIIDMYHKMMERRMMPFPKHVTREARDLIIQLLDPVPETRITLKEAINHPWLRPAKKHFIHCESAIAKLPVEISQNIVLHMADNMGISMKDVVNSVKENRASHSFAIYFLLYEKLRKFERRKKGQIAGESSFASVKVVRKATLKKDVSPKSKFMYKGVKITRSAASQQSLYEEDSSGTRSDGDDSGSEAAHTAENAERWNQYATFPRDRRTSCFNPTNVNRLVHATLDKGSDDIDYHRTSSPETTDNSASSLESTQVLRKKLMSMETRDLSMKNRTRKQSVSDEELFARSRSKSLTGQEEYDYTHKLLNGDKRHRALTAFTLPQNLGGRTADSLFPFKLQTLFSQNIPSLKQVFIPENVDNERLEWGIKESDVETFVDHESDSRDTRSFDIVAKSETNGSKENLSRMVENKDSKNRPDDIDTAVSKTPRKNRLLRLNSTKDDNVESEYTVETVADNITEIIPPPTPFSDHELKMNIEVVEPCNIKPLVSGQDRQLINGADFKVVTTGSNSKTKNSRKHQRRPAERSKSFSEAKTLSVGGKEFRRIELERVQRIELEPFQTTLAQVERVPQPSYRSPLELDKHDTLLDAPTTTGPISFERGTLLSSNARLQRTSGATLAPRDRREATEGVEKQFEASEYDVKELKANPFRINVVKLAKCQCMPVLRPKVFEPLSSSKATSSIEPILRTRANSISYNRGKEILKEKTANYEYERDYWSKDRISISDESKEQEKHSRPKAYLGKELKGSRRRAKRSDSSRS